MMNRLRKHHISFQRAASGIIWAFTTQPNFLVHLILASVALFSGLFFRITAIEMIIIVFTIILGLIVEMINTSIEAMTDLISREYSQDAKIAKDVAAGMMLVTAIGSVIVASYIFLPRIVSILIR